MFIRTMPIAAALLAIPPAADAHDQWADGSAIPAWVKTECCGISDAHHLDPEEVHVTAEGYRVAGYRGVIGEDRRLPSPDGSWWVFYRDYPDGTQSYVYCFFGPGQGS